MCRSVELFAVPRVPLFRDLLLGGSGMSAAYIFDVEGTLIDCASDTLQCRSETLAAFGVPVPSADLQLLSGMDGDEMLATLLPGLDDSMLHRGRDQASDREYHQSQRSADQILRKP